MKNARRLTVLAWMLSEAFREPSPVRGTMAASSLDVRAVLGRRHAAGALCVEGSHIY